MTATQSSVDAMNPSSVFVTGLSLHVIRKVAALCCLFSLLTTNAYADEEERTTLKVCADPHYMPFSSENLDGFENKLAEIVAKELGLEIEYSCVSAAKQTPDIVATL